MNDIRHLTPQACSRCNPTDCACCCHSTAAGPVLNDGTQLPSGHHWHLFTETEVDVYGEWDHVWRCLSCQGRAYRQWSWRRPFGPSNWKVSPPRRTTTKETQA